MVETTRHSHQLAAIEGASTPTKPDGKALKLQQLALRKSTHIKIGVDRFTAAEHDQCQRADRRQFINDRRLIVQGQEIALVNEETPRPGVIERSRPLLRRIVPRSPLSLCHSLRNDEAEPVQLIAELRNQLSLCPPICCS